MYKLPLHLKKDFEEISPTNDYTRYKKEFKDVLINVMLSFTVLQRIDLYGDFIEKLLDQINNWNGEFHLEIGEYPGINFSYGDNLSSRGKGEPKHYAVYVESNFITNNSAEHMIQELNPKIGIINKFKDTFIFNKIS